MKVYHTYSDKYNNAYFLYNGKEIKVRCKNDLSFYKQKTCIIKIKKCKSTYNNIYSTYNRLISIRVVKNE